jgi:hypothetical protein
MRDGSSLSTVYQASTTITSDTYGAWVNWYTGTPADGVNLEILVTAVTGTPNVLFVMQWSEDGVNYGGDFAILEGPPINAIGKYGIHFAHKAPYSRLAALYMRTQPGESSSSSTGETGSLQYQANLVIGNTWF